MMMTMIRNAMTMMGDMMKTGMHIDTQTNGAGQTTMQTTERTQTTNWLRTLMLLPLFLLGSLSAEAAMVPGAPTNVLAAALNTYAVVTFIAPISNGGSAITGYTVTSSPAGGVDSNAGTTGWIHVITGLTNGTAYTFTVKATNSVGTGPASKPSNSVIPVPTIPGPPTIGTATGGNASATVTFSVPAYTGGSAITGYTVTSSPAGGVDSTAGTTGLIHVITGLTNGTAYIFTVKATNSVGTGPASFPSNSVTPAPTVPGAPTIGTATAGNTSATVTFSAPASNGGSAITGYTVTSSPAGGVDSNAGTTGLSHVITGLTNGTAYTFTVTATNAKGTSAASAASNSITPSAPPTVSLTSPVAHAVSIAPGSFALTANASSPSSTVAKVEFYAGTTLLGTATAAPYTFNWTNVPAGTYSLTAKATDALGTTATSAAISVTSDQVPTVTLTTPAPGAQITSPSSYVLTATASSVTSTIAKVDFYNGTSLLGTATAAPYSFTWSNVPVGSYTLTAVATDALGISTTSAPINVSAIANVPPAVSLTSPANGATATAPATLTLTANATSTTSTVVKVDFYNGTTLLGTATTVPYSFTWSNVPIGSYTLTAVATDTLNATTTSVPVTVTVNTGIAQAYYIHADHLDTPRVITNSTGNVVWQWDNVDPFGNNIPNENPGGAGTFQFPLRFAGQYADRETNTFYNFYRDAYDPALGRYTQFDPIGLQGGINGYVYVLNNPLSYTDPTGESIPGVLACIAAGYTAYKIWNFLYKSYSAAQDVQQQSSNISQCSADKPDACNAAQSNSTLPAIASAAKAGAKLPGTLSGGKLPSRTNNNQ